MNLTLFILYLIKIPKNCMINLKTTKVVQNINRKYFNFNRNPAIAE